MIIIIGRINRNLKRVCLIADVIDGNIWMRRCARHDESMIALYTRRISERGGNILVNLQKLRQCNGLRLQLFAAITECYYGRGNGSKWSFTMVTRLYLTSENKKRFLSGDFL